MTILSGGDFGGGHFLATRASTRVGCTLSGRAPWCLRHPRPIGAHHEQANVSAIDLNMGVAGEMRWNAHEDMHFEIHTACATAFAPVRRLEPECFLQESSVLLRCQNFLEV